MHQETFKNIYSSIIFGNKRFLMVQMSTKGKVDICDDLYLAININELGCCGGVVVKNLPVTAGGHGVEPWSGKIPHATEQLSPCTTITEPTHHKYWSLCAYSPCSTTREANAMRSPCTTTKSSPSSPQLEKHHAQQRRPNAAKNK